MQSQVTSPGTAIGVSILEDSLTSFTGTLVHLSGSFLARALAQFRFVGLNSEVDTTLEQFLLHVCFCLASALLVLKLSV